MLLALRDFLKARRVATLGEIVNHLQQPEALVRGLLAHWGRKARVSRCVSPSGCGTRCQSCAPSQTEVYQWHESPPDQKIN